MRYCICGTKNKNGMTSFPYILVEDNATLKFVPYLIRDCKDVNLLIVDNLNEAEKALREIRRNRYIENNDINNYFLIKIDSLNFPFKIKANKGKRRVRSVIFIKCEVLGCKEV